MFLETIASSSSGMSSAAEGPGTVDGTGAPVERVDLSWSHARLDTLADPSVELYQYDTDKCGGCPLARNAMLFQGGEFPSGTCSSDFNKRKIPTTT